MPEIDEEIKNISNIICANIDSIDFNNISRGLASQNLLAQSRNLVEHIAVKIYGQGKQIQIDYDQIKASLDYIKRFDKYSFLREFHSFLQESVSHYSPDKEGAERLVLKYYHYYLQIRSFMKETYGMEILHNLDKFPRDTDKTVQEYHEKIAKRINDLPVETDWYTSRRMYVHKVIPFAVSGKVFYEVTLTPAYDTVSKFDRFVCYSAIPIPSHYSLKAGIYHDDITVQNKKMPVDIIVNFIVSIRPCELKDYAKLFGKDIDVPSKSSEYVNMMNYLTRSGASLLEIVQTSEQEYAWIKGEMFNRSRTHRFEEVLDRSRILINENRPGSNVIRYLLNTLNNKIIKNQHSSELQLKLSGLYLKPGCIPFDTMPFASSLIKHNPGNKELFESISSEGRKHELLARYILANMNENSRLYTPVKEVEEFTDDVDSMIKKFNSNLYHKHQGRRIEKFGKYLYIKEAYDQTVNIIKKLQEASEIGIAGYSDAINMWLEEANLDSEEKKKILHGMFVKSKLALIYGAAGTGKTYLINKISQFFGDRSKLYLANTNPAVDNLRRRVNVGNSSFMTISKFLKSKKTAAEYDLLIIDECSMVSNADMSKLLDQVKYRVLILVGDTYQIESIVFGNWFSMAYYYVPKYAMNVLEAPYRTKDQELLNFWGKVRNYDNDLTEYITAHHYASNLDSSIFERESEDEIILCLNYDGLYGINNINRFLQKNNPYKEYRWGMWTFKVNDPVLFNESDRFRPVLYNNLKGRIVDIDVDKNRENIWFTIEIDKALTELDVENLDLELLESQRPGKSIIRFQVTKKKDSDDDDDTTGKTDIPFQIAYAVSIHKAQGLEYDSVKIVITKDVDEMVSHNVFYTAITRSRKNLKIYWSAETQYQVLSRFKQSNVRNDANIFSGQSGLKMLNKKN